ncbi:MAG: aminodeoxychorismate/anthranilate synthase component II [Clostridiales Family XIII bacterium]|jgi:anthranilate synthase component 2|nr:aminodeoxychorismate/anthranilate synthase component II [Clostridiales Family XIII bacterium]
MILLIDNYDSFTFNLYQMAGVVDPDIRVVKNDALRVEELEALDPTHILISPGPGRPREAGVCEEAILRFRGKVPLLGVCLGHQAICEAFGAEIVYAATLMHGKRSAVHIANGSPVFRGLPPIIEAARYHSLAVDRATIPDELLIIAEDESGEVMGVKHRDYDIYGVQFHPESILTRDGERILGNFLSIGAGAHARRADGNEADHD